MLKTFVFSSLLLLQLCQCQRVPYKINSLQLRLVPINEAASPSLLTSGILEIELGGEWFRFCDSGWGKSESYVACGQLGFTDTLGKTVAVERQTIRQRDGRIGIKTVNCTGNESQLLKCEYQNIVDGGFCGSDRAVALHCLPPVDMSATPESRDVTNGVRLRGGALTGEGRVQVLTNGRWKDVCINAWSVNYANVVCRQLGFGTARNAHKDTRFGRGQHHRRLLLNDLNCYGDERMLNECPYQQEASVNLTEADCSPTKWASVSCFVPDRHSREKIDLLDGPNVNSGRVVVQLGRMATWGSICSDHWGMAEAAVVCRQMGLGYASEALNDVWHFTESSRYLFVVATEVQCRGHEELLEECQYKLTGQGNNPGCKNGIRYAGVTCAQRLPDLQLDIEELETSFVLDSMPLNKLECAASQGCLAPTSLVNSRNSTIQLLRFTISAWNRGTADYKPKLDPEEWIWHLCHQHYHSEKAFAHYDLLSVETLQSAAYGQKASFCLEDVKCEDGQTRQYLCEDLTSNLQGLSVGCADVYYSDYDCQWIDITDLKPGQYYFKVSLNPLKTTAETDFLNNLVMCELIYTGTNVFTRNCHMPDDYATSL